MVFSKWNLQLKDKLKKLFIYNFYKNYYFYHVSYKLKKIVLSIKWNFSKALKDTVSVKPKIKIKSLFFNFFKNLYPIKFKDSSNTAIVQYNFLKNYSFFFIRKNRIFNKGRYSRNRQLYRTGVYWCLWLNVIVVYGLYFLFYRFSFNFGYVWLGMFILILSTIFGRVLKNNFHNIFYLLKEFVFFRNWFFAIFSDISDIFFYFVNLFFKELSLLFTIFKKNPKYSYLLPIIIYVYDYFVFFYSSVKMSKDIYIWEIMLEQDESIFKYKTVIHWLKQIYYSLTY